MRLPLLTFIGGERMVYLWLFLAVAAPTGAFILYRNQKRQRTMRELAAQARSLEEDLQSRMFEATKRAGRTTAGWITQSFREIHRADLLDWEEIMFRKDEEVEVILPYWRLLKWLTVRSNPQFRILIEPIETKDLDSVKRLILLRNDRGITRSMLDWIDHDLERTTWENYREILEGMKKYVKLRRKLQLIS